MDVSNVNLQLGEKARLQAQFEASFGKTDEITAALAGLQQEAEAGQELPSPAPSSGVVAAAPVWFRVSPKAAGIGVLVVGVLLAGTMVLTRRGDPGNGLARARTLASQLNVSETGKVVDTGGCPGVLIRGADPCVRRVEIPLASAQEQDRVLTQLKGQDWTVFKVQQPETGVTQTMLKSAVVSDMCIEVVAAKPPRGTAGGSYAVWVEAPSDDRCTGS